MSKSTKLHCIRCGKELNEKRVRQWLYAMSYQEKQGKVAGGPYCDNKCRAGPRVASMEDFDRYVRIAQKRARKAGVSR